MDTTQSIGGYLTPYDFEMITVSTTSIGFTAAKLAPGSTSSEKALGRPRLVIAQVQAQSIRYRYDGGTPVATSSGQIGVDKEFLTFSNLQSMKNFRAVREGGVDATLAVTYLR